MKAIIPGILIVFLASCAQGDYGVHPSERILEFRDSTQIIGYGVREDDAIITATHVVELCKKIACVSPDGNSLTGTILSRNDLSILYTGSSKRSFQFELPQKGDGIYLLRSEEGKYRRYDAKVTALETDYIAFDSKLAPKYYTGAIEIDIALREGESGLPVWSSSGELIGIVSATDMVNEKSYIVQ